jgi:hypothetical protein
MINPTGHFYFASKRTFLFSPDNGTPLAERRLPQLARSLSAIIRPPPRPHANHVVIDAVALARNEH